METTAGGADLNAGSFFRDLGPEGDGLADYVFVDHKSGEVSVRRQTPHGMASGEPETYHLPAEAWLYDFGDLDGRAGEEIAYLSRNGSAGILIPDPKAPATAVLFQFADSSLEAPPGLSRGDFLIDLNGDGRLDIVTPGQSSFDWRIQTAPGQFSPGPSLEASAQTRVAFRVRESSDLLFGPLGRERVHGDAAGESFNAWPLLLRPPQPPFSISFARSLSSQSFHLKDLNGDGRLDIDGRPPIFQGSDGRFDLSSQSSSHSTYPEEEEPAASQDFAPWRHYMREDLDLNGDGIRDRLAILHPQTLLKDPETRLAVQIRASDGKTVLFSQDERFKGFQWRQPLLDLDGDGALDLFLISIDFDLASVNAQVKAFLGKGLDGEIQVHFWREGKGFDRKPDVRRRIRLVGDPRGLLLARPKILYSEDLTGDGRPDLLVREAPCCLTLIPYVPAERQYARSPAGTISLPADPLYDPAARDLNNDGKSDLLLTLPVKDKPDEYRLFVAVMR